MFLAHSSSLTLNSYQVLNQYNKQKVLVSLSEPRLVSNICPHQKSLISINNGVGNRVCPYHNWSFTLEGSPLGSGRTSYYCKNQKALDSLEVFEWNSLLFSTKVSFNIAEDFSDMVLIENRVDRVKADYKTIMDIFLDVDHIQTVHQGVYDLIGISDTNVKWEYYENGSVQKVAQGALWIAVYPYTMIEWQNGSLFVTVTVPNGRESDVHVFKYMDLRFKPEWEINQQVWETAWSQDKQQAELITEFTQSNLEPQKIHFREFLNGTHKE